MAAISESSNFMQSTSFSASAYQMFHEIMEDLGVEFFITILVVAGFLLFRDSPRSKKAAPKKHFKVKQQDDPPSAQAKNQMLSAKQLEANWCSGQTELVLQEWPYLERFSIGALRSVTEALLSSNRQAQIPETVRQILDRHAAMRSPDALRTVLEVLPKSASGTASEVKTIFSNHQSRAPRTSTRPAAPAEQPQREALSAAVHAHLLKVRAAVQDGCLDQALEELSTMCKAGHTVPANCIVSIVRLSGDSDPSRKVLEELPQGALSADAVVSLLDYSERTGSTSLLQEVHQIAVRENIALQPASNEVLLRGYAAVGNSHAVESFDRMIADGYVPPESVLTAVVSLCAESRHVQMAEHILSYARKANGRVSLAMYSALMKVYGQSRLFHKTCDLFEVMTHDGVKPDTVIYGSLIKAAVESGRLELARKLFQESGNPDLLNYMSLIRAAGRERDMPKALRLLQELEASPLVVDVTAYNCALEVCAACGDRGAAEGLLKRMETSGHVDVVSYNTFLKVLLAENDFVHVRKVLQNMRDRNLKPNVVTYNSLVKGAVVRQDLAGAWSLVDEMVREEVWPDAFTCSILMKAIKHQPSTKNVDRIIELIERVGVVADEVLVNCLLEACVCLRDVDRITKVLEQFKSTGVVPSSHACATLIRAYGHSRRIDRAWALWRELMGGRMTIPSEEAFASMVDACLAVGDIAGVGSVFREVQPHLQDFPRAPAVFSSVVKACIQCKRPVMALELFEDLKNSFTCTKVTYNTLLDALVKQSNIGKASDLFQEMTMKNVLPDLISYSTLIKGHCARGDLEEGLRLLGLMQRQGIAPDAILFNSILDGCAHKQMRTLTEQVLADMEATGIAPSNFTLSILVKLYGRCGDLDAARRVVDLYPRKYRFEVNAQVFTCLMSACIANGELAQALQVYRSMGTAGCACDAKTYQTLMSGCIRHGDVESAAQILRDALVGEPNMRLPNETAESVLLMAVRRGRGNDLAVSLLNEMQTAGVHVSERVAAAVRQGEEPQHHGRHGPSRSWASSHQQWRQEQPWRNKRS